MNDTLQKGKGNGQRKAYLHSLSTNAFGVADRIKEAKKGNKRKFNKRRK